MALHPLELETYRIVADPTMDAGAKQQAIDALWGAPAIAQPPGPDLRTASFDANAPLGSTASIPDQPPAPSPSVPDVPAGGMSLPPDANMSVAPPVSVAAPAALPPDAGPNMSQYTPPAPVAAAPPGMTADDKLNTAVGALTMGALRGVGGVAQAAHDQPVSSMVEKGAAVPEDIKERIATSEEAEAGHAINQGEVAATNDEAAQRAASHEVVQARAEETEQKLKDGYARDHLQKIDSDYQQMVKDTAIQPNDWWTSRDTGHKILAIIAAGMFGLAGDPNGVTRMVESDMSRRSLERDKQLGAFRSRIEDLKGQMLSPEAAHQAEMALGLRAAAAEAKRLAASAAAPEARANALAQAQHLETQAALLEGQMAQSEGGTIKTQIAHVPARVIGGTAGGLAGLKKLKEAGLDPVGAIRAATGGSYEGTSPEDKKGMVIFPDHTVGYTSEDLHKETQNELDSLGKLQGNLGRIKALMTAGHSIAGADKERLKTLVADTTLQLSSMARGEGAQARMAGEMLTKLGPLTGSGALETSTLDATAKAGIDEAVRLYDGHVETIKSRLTPSPKTAPSGGKIQTLGKSKEDVGFKAE